MDIQAPLSTIAEVAITLAGFSGMVIALAANGRDSPQAFFRVSAIVAAYFVLVVAALLPTGHVAASVSEQMSFGIASVFLGVGFIAVGTSMAIAGSKGVFVSSTPVFFTGAAYPIFWPGILLDSCTHIRLGFINASSAYIRLLLVCFIGWCIFYY